jgi:hypothetical protein
LGGTDHWLVASDYQPDIQARLADNDDPFRTLCLAASCRKERPSWPIRANKREVLALKNALSSDAGRLKLAGNKPRREHISAAVKRKKIFSIENYVAP